MIAAAEREEGVEDVILPSYRALNSKPYCLWPSLEGLFDYQMFDINIDEYLDDEVEHVREVLEAICKEGIVRPPTQLEKRQIISLVGGFQAVADLDAYHAFISSLKIPNITLDFSHLKRLGHVFVVEDVRILHKVLEMLSATEELIDPR
ncbi:hypothetical protein BDZ94DRAFT_1314715 [Collybia nuda]|uniref:Uncharacterized protein n=1 Tax=Collybia nuda TaxID=64659 RepID=A0A9P5XWK6_9AGAR|nr:hypothetical protein BDZ94DRAFT_1314715 [Collybia nuda]